MRHINWRNLGWLVSTLMFYGIAIPFLGYFMYRLLKHGIVVNNVPMLILSAISVFWYEFRNSKFGYGNYFRNWLMDRQDAEWQAEMRAKRERACIKHYKKDNMEYDRKLAK